MVNAELGIKRTCPNCAARFYDLLKDPITCPKCETSFIAQSILPSKGEFPSQMAAPVPKPREKDEDDDQDLGDVELISLEEVEEDGKDDETAGIEDVDLGEDAGGDAEEEDDTFLVEEEEDGNMSDLVEGGGGKDDDEQ